MTLLGRAAAAVTAPHTVFSRGARGTADLLPICRRYATPSRPKRDDSESAAQCTPSRQL